MTDTRWDQIPAQKPARRLSAAMLRSRVKLVTGVVVAAAALGPCTAIINLTSGADKAPASVEQVPAASLSSALAQRAAEDLLLGQRTAVPLADGLDADLGTTSSLAAELTALVPSGSADAGDITTHRFLASLSDGTFLEVSVPMRETPEGPVLVAYPSALPVARPAGTYPAADYTDHDAAMGGVPAPIVDRAAAWAAAYAANDSAALQAITDLAGTYRGLGGFEAAEVRAISAVALEGDRAYVRVRVVFARVAAEGSNLPGDGGPEQSEPFEMTNDFDLLVAQASTAVPKIVAWGPAGGPSLTAGVNNLIPTPASQP